MYKKDTENFDVGQIDVFIRDKKSKGFVFKRTTINGFKPKSRFGSTIAKLGDVNDDGFNDLAVAAPYDGDDESGIVYIFHGCQNGLKTTPDQVDFFFFCNCYIKHSDETDLLFLLTFINLSRL